MADDLIDKMNKVRLIVGDAQEQIKRLAPGSREMAMTMTKLDEARLWGLDAVAVAHLPSTPPDH